MQKPEKSDQPQPEHQVNANPTSSDPKNPSPLDENKVKVLIDDGIWKYVQRLLWIIGVIGAVGSALGFGTMWLALKQTAVDEVRKNLPRPVEEIKILLDDLEGTKSDLQELSKQMPVGTVLPVALPVAESDLYTYLPRNWVLCDGKTLNEQHPRKLSQNEVHSIFWNQVLPDFRDRFLKGVVEGGQIPNLSGANEIPAHRTAVDGNHAHHLTGTTGSVSRGGRDPGGHAYSVRDDHDNGYVTNKHIAVDGGDSAQEGQHRHDLGGITVDDGAHQHIVPAVPFTPKNASVYFIMRIK